MVARNLGTRSGARQVKGEMFHGIVRRAMSHCQPPTEKCEANDRANEPNPPRVTPPEPVSEAVPDDEGLDEESLPKKLRRDHDPPHPP
jgi:hypothetical protein